MGALFDKYSKVLQLNRAFRRKNYADSLYIAEHTSNNLAERWNVHMHVIIVNMPIHAIFRKSRMYLLNQLYSEAEISFLKSLTLAQQQWPTFQVNTF